MLHIATYRMLLFYYIIFTAISILLLFDTISNMIRDINGSEVSRQMLQISFPKFPHKVEL